MKKILMIGCLMMSVTVLAKQKGMGLKEYINQASDLTGINYLYPKEIKGGIGATKNFKLTKENVDQLFSWILAENGYTRIKETDRTYKIVSSRDIRYLPTQMFKASKSETLNAPKNYDYYMMEYKMGSPYFSHDVARALRPFMSRYGRVIDSKLVGSLIIQDTGKNLHRLYELIKTFDVTPTEEILKKHQEQEEFERKLKLEEAKHCPSANQFDFVPNKQKHKENKKKNHHKKK